MLLDHRPSKGFRPAVGQGVAFCDLSLRRPRKIGIAPLPSRDREGAVTAASIPA
jgi:hypothetical protein